MITQAKVFKVAEMLFRELLEIEDVDEQRDRACKVIIFLLRYQQISRSKEFVDLLLALNGLLSDPHQESPDEAARQFISNELSALV